MLPKGKRAVILDVRDFPLEIRTLRNLELSGFQEIQNVVFMAATTPIVTLIMRLTDDY